MENNKTLMEFKEFVEKEGIIFDDERDERRFLDIVVEELEVRIGAELSSNCSPEELDEFDSISDAQEVKKWLERKIPHYGKIVSKQKEIMKKEIIEFSDFIVAEKRKAKNKKNNNV